LPHKNEEKSDGFINWTKSRSHLIRNFIPTYASAAAFYVYPRVRESAERGKIFRGQMNDYIVCVYVHLLSVTIRARHVSPRQRGEYVFGDMEHKIPSVMDWLLKFQLTIRLGRGLLTLLNLHLIKNEHFESEEKISWLFV
jgi:hypothetical protein